MSEEELKPLTDLIEKLDDYGEYIMSASFYECSETFELKEFAEALKVILKYIQRDENRKTNPDGEV